MEVMRPKTTPARVTRDTIPLRCHVRSWAASPPRRTRRPARPISGRVSGCSELKSLFEAHSSLSSSVQRLLVNLPSDLFDPEFSRQFNRFSAVFNIFARQLSVFIASPGTRRRVLFASSPLRQAADSLAAEWAGFIGETNALSAGSVSPHLARVSDHFAALDRDMNIVLDLITSSNFRSSAPQSSWDALAPIILRMRDQCDGAFVADGARRFDADDFDGHAIAASRIVANLFDRQMPRFARVAGDCGRIKAEMSHALAALGPLMRAAQAFESIVGAIKKRILRFGAELAAVHERFELPVAVRIEAETADGQPTEHQAASVHPVE
jgi:hypothetical protein